MLAKNFLISPFKTQAVRVLLRDTCRQYCRNLFIARCVPLPRRHENESKINFESKYGYKTR